VWVDGSSKNYIKKKFLITIFLGNILASLEVVLGIQDDKEIFY